MRRPIVKKFVIAPSLVLLALALCCGSWLGAMAQEGGQKAWAIVNPEGDYKAQLHVLHVLEPYYVVADVNGVADQPTQIDRLPTVDERLTRFCKEHLQAVDDTVIHKTVVGRPFLEIIRYAKDNQIDLIVLGTHGRGVLSHVLIGSVAEKVVRKAPCPVLTVRHPEHEFVMP